MLLDLSPLKALRDYRLLFFGQLVSFFGTMMTFIVVPWQMFQLTQSSAMVGYLELAEFVPMFCLAFLGGALADYVDKRQLLRLTEIGQTTSRRRSSSRIHFCRSHGSGHFSLSSGFMPASRPCSGPLSSHLSRKWSLPR